MAGAGAAVSDCKVNMKLGAVHSKEKIEATVPVPGFGREENNAPSSCKSPLF